MIGKLLAVPVCVVAIALVNGGYVYKTSCPLPSGGAQSSWTYGIDDVLPYIRTTSAPCVSHTGTRLALSALGIDRIGADTHEAAPPATDTAGARALGRVTHAINTEYARQRRAGAAFTALMKQRGSDDPSIRKLYARLMNSVVSRMRAAKRMLVSTPSASDADVESARQLLVKWFDYQLAVDQALRTDLSKATLNALAKRVGTQLNDVVNELRAAAAVVDAKYPGTVDWSFLTPASGR